MSVVLLVDVMTTSLHRTCAVVRLPDGRCSLLEADDASADNTMNAIVSSLEDMQAQHSSLREDMESLRLMMVQTLAQLSGVPGAKVQLSIPSGNNEGRSR